MVSLELLTQDKKMLHYKSNMDNKEALICQS